MLRDRVHLVHRLLRSAGRDKEVHPRDLQHSSVDSDGWFDFVAGGVEYLSESVENRGFDVGGNEFALADGLSFLYKEHESLLCLSEAYLHSLGKCDFSAVISHRVDVFERIL